MTTIDWIILFAPLVLIFFVAFYAKKLSKSVVDFLSAGRCAGRYILCTASGEAGSAAITTIALFQMTSKTGFAFQFWGPMTPWITFILAIVGYVTYRYRETRVLTIGQFFELRYSRGFRIFMGILGFVAGLLNYGIFPVVTAQFFVYFMDLPTTLHPFDLITLQTWWVIAVAYVSVSLYFVLGGGAITILVSDCLEGMVSQIGYLILIAFILIYFGWDHIVYTITHRPEHQSMVNPFDMSGTQDFNLTFIVIGIITGLYHRGATQNGVSFKASAFSPHEQRMSEILGSWRGSAYTLMRTLLAIAAIGYLAHPDFAAGATAAHETINGITNPEMRDRMEVPVTVGHYLPWGLKGLFCAIMLMGAISGDGAALHSYGSVFVQDVLLPITKWELSPEKHIAYLRRAILAVAVFAFIFSMFIPATQKIQLYWIITGAVYAGAAGAVLVGGLYWSKGTTAGAWAAGILGSSLALTHWTIITFIDKTFFLHSQHASLLIAGACSATYMIVSIATCKQPYNMDKLLHRGEYSITGEHAKKPVPLWKKFSVGKLIGVDEEFTLGDKFATYGMFFWHLITFTIMLSFWIMYLAHPWPMEGWVQYWFVMGLSIPLVFAVGTTIWFVIGALFDLRTFFKRLRDLKRESGDDGTVGAGHPS